MFQFLDMHLKEACTDITVSRLIGVGGGGKTRSFFPAPSIIGPRDWCRVVSITSTTTRA